MKPHSTHFWGAYMNVDSPDYDNQLRKIDYQLGVLLEFDDIPFDVTFATIKLQKLIHKEIAEV